MTDLVFCSGRDVESRLPHDGHVQMVHEGNLEPLGPLVVVAVVERLDVEQHGVAVVLAGLCTLEIKAVTLLSWNPIKIKNFMNT